MAGLLISLIASLIAPFTPVVGQAEVTLCLVTEQGDRISGTVLVVRHEEGISSYQEVTDLEGCAYYTLPTPAIYLVDLPAGASLPSAAVGELGDMGYDSYGFALYRNDPLLLSFVISSTGDGELFWNEGTLDEPIAAQFDENGHGHEGDALTEEDVSITGFVEEVVLPTPLVTATPVVIQQEDGGGAIFFAVFIVLALVGLVATIIWNLRRKST